MISAGIFFSFALSASIIPVPSGKRPSETTMS
jgi:hypothetical protein